ncbi:MAG: glycosyltransferase [Ignavibacteriales bacterium]
MKVLQVSSDYTSGGASRYLLTLLSQPAFRDIDVTVACPDGGNLALEVKRLGIPLVTFPQKDRSFDARLVFELAALIRRGRFDVVHSHASVSSRLAARLSGRRNIVVTRHTIGGELSPNPLKRALTAVAQVSLASRFIAISQAIRQRLLDEGVPGHRIETIHNGVDITLVEREASTLDVRRELGAICRGSSPVIGTLGRLSPEKGHEFLVKAFAAVLREFPGAILVVVGQGDERGRLERLAGELGVAEHVVFTGYRENAAAYVNAFDVFVMPSLSEGLGLAMLEAMTLRKPVIATNTGGIPEVVAHGVNGLLVPPGDPAALSLAIAGLLRDGSLAAGLAAAGRKTVEDRFDAQSMADKTVDVYRRLLDEECGGPRGVNGSCPG